MICQTSRLILRVWDLELDNAVGQALWGDPEVTKYVDSGQPIPPEEALQSMRYGQIHQEKYGCQLWAVVLKASGEVIGDCGFSVYEGGPVLEMGFHFRPAFWGYGYATEAGKAALNYALTELCPPRIVAGIHPENVASKKVLLKLGFQDKGLLWFEDTQAYEPFFEYLPSGQL